MQRQFQKKFTSIRQSNNQNIKKNKFWGVFIQNITTIDNKIPNIITKIATAQQGRVSDYQTKKNQ